MRERWGKQMNKRLVSIVVCVVAACAFAPLPSFAQSYDGIWKGQVTCAKLSFAKGTQKVPLTMTVSGASATYTRQVYDRDNTRVVGTEEGSGTVSGNGEIKVSAKWASPNGKFAYTATYSGSLKGSSGSLRGTQVWNVEGKSENRSCSISLSR